MTIKVKSNLVSGLVLMVISIVIWLMIPMNIVVNTSGLNAQFFPKLVIGILFVIGGQLVFKSIILKSDVVKELNIMRELAVLLYGAGLCLYIFMLDKIGFLISSILVSIITLTLMKAKKKKYYIIQILIVIAVYFIFTKLLSVNLP